MSTNSKSKSAATATNVTEAQKAVGLNDVAGNWVATREAIIAQFGLGLIVGRFWYAIFTHDLIFFSIHPFFETLGLFLLAQGILLVQPAPKSPAAKEYAGNAHGLLNSAGLVSYLVGGTGIYVNKTLNNAAHFTSWHSVSGGITTAMLTLGALFGMAIFWFPNEIFGSVNAGKSFYKYHRLHGYFCLLLIATTFTLATYTTYNSNVFEIGTGFTIAGYALFLYGVFAQIKVAKIRFW
jgi:hypothetical protein